MKMIMRWFPDCANSVPLEYIRLSVWEAMQPKICSGVSKMERLTISKWILPFCQINYI